jgi:hypothetical protein
MTSRTVLMASIVALGTGSQLQAYTDPGSGALIWQMLVAGFVGSMFYIRRLTAWFRRKKP